MGKKSSDKSKLKKELKRQAQQEIVEKQTKVREACNNNDVLCGLAPLTKFVIDNEKYEINFYNNETVNEDILNNCFNMTKTNMEVLYNESDWGWKDNEKWRELRDNDARFLILYNNDNIIGFIHFRFMYDEHYEVIYLYEIQICKEYQHKGLGYKLVQLLELIGMKNQMKFCVLTCFKHNPSALRFYMNKMNYVVDAVSPSKFNIDECYEILSKCLDPHLKPPTRE